MGTSNLALTVKKASPSVASTLSSALITAGGNVTSSAALTRSYQAGGSITYKFLSGLTFTRTPTIRGSPHCGTSSLVPDSAYHKLIKGWSDSWAASDGLDHPQHP